uniref:MHC class II regulatory factor RFX1 isoform X2 n=1 Tax=Geotrypetes seraphini TaxID=260995 RepID=A0A6P8PYI6_GEOSA|nr:MHC class II regulatory factor RFX1 isoform X2 [Geotrypetes seraphini]
MATQTYVTELQAAPAQPQAAAQQYGADLQSASQQPAAQSSQKQYVAEIQSPQPQSLPAAVAPQQYIVVTVSDGPLRPGDSVSESSPGSTSAQVGVPTQVVQQVQAAQQTNSTTPKAGQVQQLQVHGVQQVSVSQERSVVQSTAQAPKTSPVQQLTVQGLQQVHVTQESPGSQLSVPARKCQPQPQPQPQEEQEQQRESETDHPPKLEDRMEAERFESTGAGLQYVQSLPSGVGSEHWVELVRVLPQQLLPPPQQQPFIPAHPQSPEERVKVQRVPQVLVFGTAATALKVQQLQQVPVQHVYPSQVQYVEGGDASYTASTIRSNTYPYTETPLYTQNAGTTYYESQATPAQVSTPATSQTVASSGSVPMYVSGGQIITSSSGGGGTAAAAAGGGATGAGTYVIQGGYMLGSSSQSYSHTTRASPATVQWLLDNYETAEGVSLPRSTLYCHYLMHCQEQKLEPVNAASFGKLIRSVFMGLRTRRLGTRGNSKYHYYGLRIKGNSSLLRLMEDQQHLAMRQQPFSQKQRLKPIQKMESMTNGVGAGQQQAVGLSDISAQVQQYQQFLDASRSLPEFVEIDLQGKALPDGLCAEEVKVFQMLYREHCEAIVDVMINLQFTLVETLWKTFWRYNLNQPSESASSAVIHDEAEKRLPKDSLVILSKYEPVLKWTKDCDNSLYQGLVEILIPDVLRPIPSALTQAVRNFAKSLESWLSSAMMNIPEEMVRVKVAAASAFAQTLRRYTSLNHLAQAARAVLQNTAQISQMLSDLNRVDFANVQEQASWVCRCEDRVVQRLEQDFKMTLQQQNSLEQWAAWLDGVVNQILKPYQGNPSFPKAAKLFLLKWSFYSSMVIRDLTLRSAASFGSFHLIRLLYDEYMYYLIEHRVAQAKGETPIAVMGEFANLASSLNPLDPDKDEEEEEEEESDEEMPQELSLHAESTTLTADPLEPPTKLARTGAIFVHAPPST